MKTGMATALMLAGAGMAMPAAAQTETKGYIGVGVAQWEFSQSGFPAAEGTGFRAIAGYEPWDFLGIELHLGGGGSDDVEINGLVPAADPEDPPVPGVIDVKVKLNQLWSLMLRPNWSFGGRFNVYGLLGYSYGKIDFKSEPSWFSESDKDISFGAGVEVDAIRDRLAIGVDYVQLLKTSDYKAESLNLGVRFKF